MRRCKEKCGQTARSEWFPEERGKSFKRKDKSIHHFPRLFFLTGRIYYAEGDFALSSSAFKEKVSPTDSAVALDFVSFPEYRKQTEVGFIIYIPLSLKEQNK